MKDEDIDLKIEYLEEEITNINSSIKTLWLVFILCIFFSIIVFLKYNFGKGIW